ncbi:ASCH domain-containing protein [Endozoicomonas euniceicola]|uniref:ASCH domain-containing protein n=1 Tax=Endozoicomonas euniceicola TaxID=1234143 RepID=A0ABY6GQQ7_9GAMM|nr:ASCH domain-containing protein [Endozoicomonas euniceicola]UYM14897.1 ASCH domain-containing protein [Endozoicomonas euniceicola]
MKNNNTTQESRMNITRALIIAEPWISKILSGEKDWEMRSTHTSISGPVGLIAKGTGTVVGVAVIKGSKGPLSQENMLNNIHRHGIPSDMINSGAVSKWNHAWQLGEVKKLSAPVPYQHKNGAVTWVNLSPETQQQLESQLPAGVWQQADAVSNPRQAPTPKLAYAKAKTPPAKATGKSLDEGEVVVTQGNINNNHIYVRNVVQLFPPECIGGANRREQASQLFTLYLDKVEEPVKSDIDGKKKIFRERRAIGQFLKLNGVVANDKVQIKKVGQYEYQVSKV